MAISHLRPMLKIPLPLDGRGVGGAGSYVSSGRYIGEEPSHGR
jgi:hypothetical protein